MLSDLHGKSYGRDNEKLLKAIETASPDLILCAGDLITAHRGEDGGVALKLLEKLGETGIPVYYSYGNHEQKVLYLGDPDDQEERYEAERFAGLRERYTDSVKGMGIRILDNENDYIEEYNIRIYGFSAEFKKHFRRFRREVMEPGFILGKLGEADGEACCILLAHNPAFFPGYADWGADLVLSGHVHGGVARLPLLGGVFSPSYLPFPEYDGGRYDRDGSIMILGRGLGMHTIHIRFNNPGELVVVDVVPE